MVLKSMHHVAPSWQLGVSCSHPFCQGCAATLSVARFFRVALLFWVSRKNNENTYFEKYLQICVSAKPNLQHGAKRFLAWLNCKANFDWNFLLPIERFCRLQLHTCGRGFALGGHFGRLRRPSLHWSSSKPWVDTSHQLTSAMQRRSRLWCGGHWSFHMIWFYISCWFWWPFFSSMGMLQASCHRWRSKVLSWHCAIAALWRRKGAMLLVKGATFSKWRNGSRAPRNKRFVFGQWWIDSLCTESLFYKIL